MALLIRWVVYVFFTTQNVINVSNEIGAVAQSVISSAGWVVTTKIVRLTNIFIFWRTVTRDRVEQYKSIVILTSCKRFTSNEFQIQFLIFYERF